MMNRLNKNCFISIRKLREDIVNLPASLSAEFAGITAKYMDGGPKARAKVDVNVVQDILSENAAWKWTIQPFMRPSLGKERGKAKDSGMASGHPEKEKAVPIIPLDVTANV